jgi:hypothetical protein
MAIEPVENERQIALPRALAWYFCGVLAAIGIGRVAAVLHGSGFAPVGLLSIAVGISLGTVLLGVARLTYADCRQRLLSGAAIFAIITILTEHAWLYRDFHRQWHEARANSPHVAMFRPDTPWSPAEYLAHEATPQQLMLWSVDALLITVATVGTLVLAHRFIK